MLGKPNSAGIFFNKFLHNDFLMSPFGKPYQTLVADFKPLRVNSEGCSFFPPEHTWLKIRPWKCLGRVNPMNQSYEYFSSSYKYPKNPSLPSPEGLL